jgi:hypothetical protein
MGGLNEKGCKTGRFMSNKYIYAMKKHKYIVSYIT